MRNLEYSGPDTSVFKYFSLDDRKNLRPAVDTLLHGFDNYAEDKNFKNAHLNLGNLGSSSTPFLYRPNLNIETRMSFNQYDLYHESVNDLRFYDLNTPYNNLFFSPVGGQSNFLVKAQFSRNFDNNLNISLDYKRINQEGFYTNQATKITSFGIGLWNHSDNHKRNTFIRFVATNNNEQHNGGVEDGADFGGTFTTNRFNIPINIRDAESRLERFQYLVDNFLEIDKFIIRHAFKYQHGFYKYSDEDIASDSSFYKQYLTETRGIRVFYGSKHLSNDFSISFDIDKFGISTGLEHIQHWFDLEAESFSRGDLMLYGKLNTNFKLVKFQGLVKAGLLNSAGNLLLDSHLEIPLSDWFNFTAHFNLSRYNASINQSQLAINHENFFNTDWEKITESAIKLTLEIPKTKTSLSWTTMTIDNLVYLNQDLNYNQLSSTLIGTQLSAVQKLHWKIFHFDNGIHLQYFDNNVLQLPGLYSRHELYVQGFLFKRKLQYSIGGSMILLDHDGGLSYSPFLGNFHPASEEKSTFYPYTEFFSNFKIGDFRFFFKIENTTNYLLDDIYYQVESYPQFDTKIRLGVGWFLKD